ncbi:zinc ribbon domain-containing protein [Haloarcula laminariae]|uniref:zinc ribbon domain-containing protein n=1 Tax=Haloarcula laminariae TaxID=2961577 RepID=UPI002405E5B3|nr:zinc ribbon domain-containing protein [Halomicroarcula sp. FL173]
MTDRPPAVELRRSVAVLATEWWLVAGGLAGYLVFGAWVVATGLAFDSFVPGLATRTLTAVGPLTVTGLVAFAAVAWLVAPAMVAAWLLDRQLSNVSGNLVDQYRIDHPGALPAPSGVLMLAATVAALVAGPRPPVLAVMALAGVHLLVRTIAFGRRVYSFSPKLLFTAMAAASGLALAAAWLVHAPRLPGTVGERVAGAGVASVVETALGAAGVGSGTALGVLVAVPALLSGLYLVVQTVVAARVRSRAPLSNPTKRAEQRYPIMPPVADSSRPGPPTPSANDDSQQATTEPSSEPATDERTADAADTDESAVTTEESDDRSHTRVFTAEEPIPDDEDAMTTVATDADEDDDGWVDDTAIFSPDGATGSDDECGECGEEIPRESVTFCPNCGERVRR